MEGRVLTGLALAMISTSGGLVAGASPALTSFVRVTEYSGVTYVNDSTVSAYVLFIGEPSLKFEAGILNRGDADVPLVARALSPATAFTIEVNIDRFGDAVGGQIG